MTDELDISEATEVIQGEALGDYQAEWVAESEKCDEIVSNLKKTDDDTEIFSQIQAVNRVERIAAKVKSKLLYNYAVWYHSKNPDGNFYDHYASRTAADKLTVQKHVKVGKLLSDPDVPDNVKEQSYKNLISVARAYESGFEFDDEDWSDISKASRESDVNAVVSKVKDKPPRKGSLRIRVYADGSITVFKDDIRVSGGWLNFQDAEENSDLSDEERKVLNQGLSKIIEYSGMTREN